MTDEAALHDRWYAVLRTGEPRVFWDGESAVQSASDWPSMTASVLHLHGTPLEPVVDVVWTPPPTSLVCECCEEAPGEFRRSADAVLCDECVAMLVKLTEWTIQTKADTP